MEHIDPRALPLVRSRAVDLHRAGKTEEAYRAYTAYLAQVPGDAGIWSNLGALFRTTQRYPAALRAQEKAMALDPAAVGVRTNYANILSDLGRYEASLAVRRALLAEDSGNLTQKAMIGRCLRGMGEYDAAAEWLTRAHAEHPDDSEIEIQLAFALLGAGRYDPGFHHYRARWRSDEMTPRDLPFPQWAGEDLAGKTVLVMPEQGFGDAVIFARLIPQLKALGPHVKLLVDKPLFRLFQNVEGVDQVVPTLIEAGTYDYWVNLMDITLLGLTSRADIPPPTRLHIPGESRARAARIVEPYGDKVRVGVVWTGSVTYKGNAFRSFSHTDFLPLLTVPGVQLFSLYKGPMHAAYVADGTNAFILDAGSTEADFADTAATMQEMDLIITSDTATAHVAGSLGVPVWTVLHWDAFWLYTHHGDATPWYPSMRLYRQNAALNWDAVMAEVTADLTTFAQKVAAR